MMTTNAAMRREADQPRPERRQTWQAVRETARREWGRAASLAERIRAHRERGSLPALLAGAQARGFRPEQQWRAQAPFQSPSVFARRLAVDGAGEREFRAILGGAMAPSGPEGDEIPGSLARWLAAFGRAPRPGRVASQATGPSTLSGGLIDVLAPVLDGVRARLAKDISQLLAGRQARPFDAAGAEALVFSLLPQQLAEIAGRTLAMELQLARLRGELGGTGPAEHLRDFIDRLCRRETALALFRQYPMLARQLAECVDTWAVAGLEFLRHLSQDWPEICARFGADPGRLVGISAAGPRCRGGRRAFITRFASGLCLVYQPRSLALEAHFQELLEWINQRSADLGFRTLTVLDRGDHGWMEFLAAGPCTSDAALSRLRRRQGAYLALMYAFDVTALPADSVLTSGEDPVLLDVAALFHPPVRDFADTGGKVAMPPEVILGNVQASVDPADRGCLEDIDVGFTAIYGLLVAHCDDLLAEGGPLARFASDEVPVMLRPAATYSRLLQEAWHPDLQRDALDRDRLFDRLWAAVADAPWFDAVVAAEQADLRRGDLPLFLGRPGSVDLRDGAGATYTGIYGEAPLDRMRRRLQRHRDLLAESHRA